MRAVVFVGPSLSGPIETDPDVTINPPAVAGDLYRAVWSGVGLIGLIDARFEDGQTVLHDEILHALKNGVHVWGAASMGALRAVECEPFGMRGHGEVFEMYRGGMLDGDHEVAMQHGPAEIGSPALSVPMVNIRATLKKAATEGVISDEESASVLSAAAELYYKDLTWPSLLERVRHGTIRDRLDKWLPDEQVDQKDKDARSLIDLIQSSLSKGLDRFAPAFEFEETLFWQRLVEVFESTASSLSDEDTQVLDELRLDPIRYSEAIQRSFARRAAQHQKPPLPLDQSGAIDDFRAELGCITAAAFSEWLGRNRTSEASLVRFLNADAHLDNTLEELAPSLASQILDDLRAEDRFSVLDNRAREKRTLLGDKTTMNMPAKYAEFDLRDLLTWFCEHKRISGTFSDPDEAAQSLGLTDRKALHLILRREFEYVNARNNAMDRTGVDQ